MTFPFQLLFSCLALYFAALAFAVWRERARRRAADMARVEEILELWAAAERRKRNALGQYKTPVYARIPLNHDHH